MSIRRSAALSNRNMYDTLCILLKFQLAKITLKSVSVFFFSELPSDWWGSKPNIYTALNEAGTVQVD